MPQTACYVRPLEAAADRWARRKLGNTRHEQGVLSIADELAGLLGPLLGLSAADVDLLRLAALTHDIGRSVSEKEHPRHGAEMITHTSVLNLTPAQRRRLAFLARYHRGAVPPTGQEEYLTAADRRPALHAVLALLRTADALDHRHLPTPTLAMSLNGRRLTIRCTVDGHLADARRVFLRRKKYRLLENLLGHTVRVSVVER